MGAQKLNNGSGKRIYPGKIDRGFTVFKHYGMKTHGGESSGWSPGRFIPGDIVATAHWIGDWKGPKAGLE